MDVYTKKLCLIISVSKVDWLLTSESVNFTELVTKAEKSTKLVTEELDTTKQDGLLDVNESEQVEVSPLTR